MVDVNRSNSRGTGDRDTTYEHPASSSQQVDAGLESGTLLSILFRRRWFVVLVLVVFGAIGAVFSQLIATSFVGVAQVIVQDPRAASQFDVTDVRPSTQDSERYLADQVKVFQSGIVASHVADDLGVDVSTVSNSLEVTGDLTSNLIEIRYSADTPEEAMTGANSVVSAYVRVVSAQVRENASVALQKIDALQQSLDDKIDALSAQINARLANSTRSGVEDQIDATIEELTQLRAERDALAVGSPARQAVAAQITELAADLDALRLSLDLEQADPELDALVSEQNQALTLRSQLDTRRNTIEVDLELASANLALVSPAQSPEEPAGVPPIVTVVGFLALGALVGLAGGHALDLREALRARPAEPMTASGPDEPAVEAERRAVAIHPIEDAPRSRTVAGDAEVWMIGEGRSARDGGTVHGGEVRSSVPSASARETLHIAEHEPFNAPREESLDAAGEDPDEAEPVDTFPEVSPDAAEPEEDGADAAADIDALGGIDQLPTIDVAAADWHGAEDPESEDTELDDARRLDGGVDGDGEIVGPTEEKHDDRIFDRGVDGDAEIAGLSDADDGSAGSDRGDTADEAVVMVAGEPNGEGDADGWSEPLDPAGPADEVDGSIPGTESAGETPDTPTAEDAGPETADSRSSDGASSAIGDDLTLLDGIGPKVQGLLNEHGILRFGELAEMTPDGIQMILDEAGSAYQLCDPHSWPLQAKLAQAGRWTALKAYKASLKAGAKR